MNGTFMMVPYNGEAGGDYVIWSEYDPVTAMTTQQLNYSMNPVPVSIIIPNYNGEEILGKTVDSVVEAADTYQGKCEIIVVDDASQDGSVKLVAEDFPVVKVVRHEENKGFSEAVHSGVRSSAYEIIILLNSDVRPDANFIAPLVRWFDREDTFSVSPLVLDHLGHPHMVSWNLVEIVRGKMRRRKWNLEEVQRLGHQGRTVRACRGALARRGRRVRPGHRDRQALHPGRVRGHAPAPCQARRRAASSALPRASAARERSPAPCRHSRRIAGENPRRRGRVAPAAVRRYDRPAWRRPRTLLLRRPACRGHTGPCPRAGPAS